MMPEPATKIVFVGNECLSSATDYQQAPILQALLAHNYTIEAVIWRNRPTRSRTTKSLAVAELSIQHNLKTFEITTDHQLATIIPTLQADIAIVVSFGSRIADDLLDYFPCGWLNVHPSLLPQYRGSTPIETALADGATTTGISLMQVSSAIDSGDIYAQASLPIQPLESKLALTTRLGQLGAQTLVTHLPQILQRTLRPVAQDQQQATFTQPIRSRLIDNLQTETATFWERYIRAYLGCPNNRWRLQEQIVAITQAEVATDVNPPAPISYQMATKTLLLQCQQDYLRVHALQPANRAIMTASEFVNGFGRTLRRF